MFSVPAAHILLRDLEGFVDIGFGGRVDLMAELVFAVPEHCRPPGGPKWRGLGTVALQSRKSTIVDDNHLRSTQALAVTEPQLENVADQTEHRPQSTMTRSSLARAQGLRVSF